MTIIFLGPLPPPVHGFSAINAAMLARLQQACGEVIVFNRAPPPTQSNSSKAQKATNALGHWIKLLGGFLIAVTRQPSAFYAGFSGGKGQLLDLPFFVAARLFGIPTYVHHHSFAYLNQPSRLTGVCMKVLSRAQHIALCPEMAQAIGTTYGIPESQRIVLSNAAFLPATAPPAPQSQTEPTRTIRVGFLSNITAEKGIFEFFAVLRRASEAGLAYEADIAGPVDPGISARFQAELAALPQARHLGPLYGADKHRFFQRIDLLLFPTRYANEAEPVTLHEALQAGASVVAANRGCIGGMLPDHCGAARPAEDFELQAIQTLQELAQLNQAQRLAKRAAIQQHYLKTAERSESALRQLVHRISHTRVQQP